MYHHRIIDSLSRNKELFIDLLTGLDKELYSWKKHKDKWSLLEIVCHLRDEEREDFRIRTWHILEAKDGPLPLVDPVAWVKQRKYAAQDYNEVLDEFLHEREASLSWLRLLHEPRWDNYYEDPKRGKMTAELYLTNWLAHDYLHMKQIFKLKFDFLQFISGEDLSYAGAW